MHVIIVALGSMGDVHPLLGIGVALKKRGHYVTVLANDYFRTNVSQVGLDFYSIGSVDEYIDFISRLNTTSQLKLKPVICEGLYINPMKPVYDYISKHYKSGETIAVCSISSLGVKLANEKFGLPMVSINLTPMMFTSTYDPPRMAPQYNPEWLPRWVYGGLFKFFGYLFHRELCPPLNKFRKELGLRPIRDVLHWMVSPDKILGLFPEWFTSAKPDWPAQAELTGFPLFDEGKVQESNLSPELQEFLAGGDAPIIFTPGTPNKKASFFFIKAMEAVQILGARAIFLTRHEEQISENLPENIRFFEYIPFTDILPRARAIVHHGGIGTIAQALQAGIPQLVSPWGIDQYDNSMRLKNLGVSDEISMYRCTGKELADKLDLIMNSSQFKAKCKEYSLKIKEIDPLKKTCEIIETVYKDSLS